MKGVLVCFVFCCHCAGGEVATAGDGSGLCGTGQGLAAHATG